MAYDYQSRQKLVEAYRAKWKRKLLLVPGEIKEAAEEMEKFGGYRQDTNSTSFPIPTAYTAGRCGQNPIFPAWNRYSGFCMLTGLWIFMIAAFRIICWTGCLRKSWIIKEIRCIHFP